MDTVGKGVPGYVTPKVAVGAAVGNDQGELLLIQRADSGIWLYPTGWCDVGYSAAEVVVKEVEEETGIEVEPVRLIAVLDGLRLGFTRVPLYSLLFYCRALGGTLQAAPARVPRRGLVHPGHHALPARRIGALGRHRLRRAGGRAPRCPLRQRAPTHVAGRSPEDLMAGDRKAGDRKAEGQKAEGHMAEGQRISVSVAARVDDELHGAVAALVPQLSSSAPPPTLDQLRRIIEDPATTLLLATTVPSDVATIPTPTARDRRGGRVVGMLTLAIFLVPTGLRAWIEDVVVDEHLRGAGVASELIRAAVDHAERQGARTVDLTSRPQRERRRTASTSASASSVATPTSTARTPTVAQRERSGRPAGAERLRRPHGRPRPALGLRGPELAGVEAGAGIRGPRRHRVDP